MEWQNDDDGAKKQDSLQDYLILILTDSNLPTGGFVASSGLESYYVHGLLSGTGLQGCLDFIERSLQTYARSSLPFLRGAHAAVSAYCHEERSLDTASATTTSVMQRLAELDAGYHTITLNHVARRASMAQGTALLTLYTKSFAWELAKLDKGSSRDESKASQIVKAFKNEVRIGSSPGHLAVCWGAFAAALNIEQERATQVHLFLQARAIVSSAVRLNIVGPYLAHSILAFHVKSLIEAAAHSAASPLQLAATPAQVVAADDNVFDDDEDQGWAWDWDDEAFWKQESGPKTTWPLGELIQGRHDALHSRLFNS
ncbi:hypothetical protein FA10DRAFT_267607 [Acaromyces ingoldii]|uniref:Urease accessory protein UreF n=1 Tax=Acaromyces ingoldii TaxID=215250 RepID=A0A316YIH2_9BASI|nr:hypothetical protein FA10DRAFT_267607 [Acaromyces ingoldii]PWN88999.1 hypothetical protein FA10DRAFT_267607 [Acaromyces ingoldii]